jgi:hypothetical protein
MTKATNDDGARMYGERYHDTAGLSAHLLALTMHTALVEARDAGRLPTCRFRLSVSEGAPLGDPVSTALRVCVELHGLNHAELFRGQTGPAWAVFDAPQALLTRDVHAELRPFGWHNPAHPLTDRRFRGHVHLAGIHEPVPLCHLCGRPHPAPADDPRLTGKA